MSSPPESHQLVDTPAGSPSEQRRFLLGLVEGFYGRPFTSEQRKDLFKKLKKFGHQLYIYAPKDDYKHRASWREMYTVEEGENLQSLIASAKSCGIDFYYALSPGLDITYSSLKDTAALKRKLDQVSQFGCEHFALLFDDIESEMTKSDKEVFSSFAHAQVTISNDIYLHLNRNQPNRPNFLFCPTQYCSTRAVPSVTESEYLSTIGQKLHASIDIMWTGSKVISKVLTSEEILEITEVFKRKPVIWDNLHANDYDQKRVFLGPYSGRSPELISLLRGVVTNPNCEFHANTIAIHTLGCWSRCNTEINSSISDIKLETENDDDDDANPPNYITQNIYHPRVALKNAIAEWLPEFFEHKKAFGPISKPHPAQAITAPIVPPIMPSVNTCMTLTLTTPTTTDSSMNMIPEVDAAQLHALADICSAVTGIVEMPKSNMMNSLASATKVITTDVCSSPIIASTIAIPDKVPISCCPIPINVVDVMDIERTPENEPMDCCITPKHTSDTSSLNSDIPIVLEPSPEQQKEDEILKSQESSVGEGENDSAADVKNSKSQLSDDVVMTETPTLMQVESAAEEDEEAEEANLKITFDDILLFCDLFYLPFEHGKQGVLLLNEFHWLKTSASVLSKKNQTTETAAADMQEWHRRCENLLKLIDSIYLLTRKLAGCVNQELCHDLFPYVWEISSVVSIFAAYVKWLSLACFPENASTFVQGSYTWFSKGWKETFMSGEHEPWVFRGGLIADLQRLIPVDSGNDLFLLKLPETPTLNFFTIRPYVNADEADVYSICHRTCRDGSDCTELFPESLQEIAADRLIAPFITLNPEFCMVIENNEKSLIGYACAALDSKLFYRGQETLWVPSMCEKYPLSLLELPEVAASQASKDAISWFHNFKYDTPDSVLNTYPSIMTCCVLKEQMEVDLSVCKRLLCVLLAALRTNGSSGVHCVVNSTDAYMQQFYGKLGFTEVYCEDNKTILGRKF